MKVVSFGSFFESYGRQEIELPDKVDANDKDAVINYLKGKWDDIPLPSSDYVTDSHELDEGSLVIYDRVDIPNQGTFSEDGMSIDNGFIRVEWYNADEGWCGDYDPTDPEDQNLLRFDVYIKRDGAWEAVEDASYCTRMPADTQPEILKRALKLLLKEYTNALKSDPYVSVKRLGESYSWISPDWFLPDITRDTIREGIQKGIVRFVKDPNAEKGTVCKIGENWFYMGGRTAEEESPEEYVRDTPEDDLVEEIFQTLDTFKRELELRDEYYYYASYLQENLKEAV